jgi:hypothetical protein
MWNGRIVTKQPLTRQPRGLRLRPGHLFDFTGKSIDVDRFAEKDGAIDRFFGGKS